MIRQAPPKFRLSPLGKAVSINHEPLNVAMQIAPGKRHMNATRGFASRGRERVVQGWWSVHHGLPHLIDAMTSHAPAGHEAGSCLPHSGQRPGVARRSYPQAGHRP